MSGLRDGWARLRSGEGMPGFLQAGSEFRRWTGLSLRSLRTVWGVGLAVAGTTVTGAGLGLLLHGTGVRALDLARPDSEALSSGLVTALIGTFLLGLAVESGLRVSEDAPGVKAWESALAAAAGLVAFVPVTWLLAGFADRLVVFSDLFGLIPEQISLVGRSGVSAALAAGVPLMWLLRHFASPRWREHAPALLYAAWLTGFIWLYRPLLPA